MGGNILSALVGVFIGIAEVILGLRILFRLVNANPAAAFVDWIYRTSNTLMEPFRGIFPPATAIDNGIVLDIPAIFAIIMYLVFGALLMWVLSLIPSGGGVTRVTRVKK